MKGREVLRPFSFGADRDCNPTSGTRTLKGTMRVCTVCDATFGPTRREQKCCGAECAHEATRRSKPKVQANCAVCKKKFIPRDRRYSTCCSRECGFGFNRRSRLARSLRQALVEVLRELRRDRATIERTCKICGDRFITRPNRWGPRSNTCRKEALRRRKGKGHSAVFGPFRCRQCAREVNPNYGSRFRTYCSRRCSDQFARRARNRRMKLVAAKYERFADWIVFERDRWICQICLRPIDRELPSGNRMAPTIDHIIPISRGGSHIPGNCQSAHLLCNASKGSLLPNEIAEVMADSTSKHPIRRVWSMRIESAA